MVLKNKLGIENSAELARLEEQISKKKAAQLLKKVSYSRQKLGLLQVQHTFIRLFLRIFTTLQGKFVMSILPKIIFNSPHESFLSSLWPILTSCLMKPLTNSLKNMRIRTQHINSEKEMNAVCVSGWILCYGIVWARWLIEIVLIKMNISMRCLEVMYQQVNSNTSCYIL